MNDLTDARPLVGFAFPFRIADGGVKRAEGYAKIEQDLLHLLSTRLGERTMLRTYGGGVHHRLQEPNDNTLRTLVQYEIEQGLRTFLPDVRLTAPIQLTTVEEVLTITITYRANPDDMVRRLVLRLG